MIKPITRIQRNVHVIELSEEQEFLKISDVHWDNPKCNRELLISHLDEAKRRNAIITINGDFLCLMQGKFDPRGSKKDVRPEHNKGNYLDLVIEDAAEFLAPYADHIAVIGYGNHETNIIKRLETDPLQRMVDIINYKTKGNVQTGGYGGWVVYKFELYKGGLRGSYKNKYFHGSGGGGPVTKNTIGHQRLDAMIGDADMIEVGHTHDLWTMTTCVETLDHSYNTKLRNVTHIQTGCYKEEYEDGNGGWHIERGAPPKPLGGFWVKLIPSRVKEEGKQYVRIDTEVTKTRG